MVLNIKKILSKIYLLVITKFQPLIKVINIFISVIQRTSKLGFQDANQKLNKYDK